MSHAQIRGVQLHYRIFGDRGPWVALVTGGRRGFQEFIEFAEKISAQGFQVLLHDRRNTGASDVLIAGEDGDQRPLDDRLRPALPRRQPFDQLLQTPERARRLGERRIARAHRRDAGCVGSGKTGE